MNSIILFIIILLFIIAIKSILIVPHGKEYIIEKFGKYYKTETEGFHFIIPFIYTVVGIQPITSQTLNINQKLLSNNDLAKNDENTIKFDIKCNLNYKIVNSCKATYEIQNLSKGLEYLVLTCIKDTIKKAVESKKSFTNKELENSIYQILLKATEIWGCNIESIEIIYFKLAPELVAKIEPTTTNDEIINRLKNTK